MALVKIDQMEKAVDLQDLFTTALASTVELVPQVWSAEVINSSVQVYNLEL